MFRKKRCSKIRDNELQLDEGRIALLQFLKEFAERCASLETHHHHKTSTMKEISSKGVDDKASPLALSSFLQSHTSLNSFFVINNSTSIVAQLLARSSNLREEYSNHRS